MSGGLVAGPRYRDSLETIVEEEEVYKKDEDGDDTPSWLLADFFVSIIFITCAQTFTLLLNSLLSLRAQHSTAHEVKTWY